MKQDEIIKEVIALGIVAEIAGEFFITEKYKELIAGVTPVIIPDITPPKLNYDKLLDGSTNGVDWPVEVMEAKGRARATALMDVCNIPTTAAKGYRLRGLNKDAVNVLGNIVSDESIDPNTFIGAVKAYYTHTEMPKGFKNLLLDGDVLDIYHEFIAGTLLNTLKADNNQKWR